MINNPFNSFWMAGYECSDQLNASGERVDFLNITNHLELIETDYSNLDVFKIKTVREGIRWSMVEKLPGVYDWRTVERMILVAKACGIQQVWDICHFGFPDDIDTLHPCFTQRFVDICREFVKFYRQIEPDQTLIVVPINEVSFISWLGGEDGKTVPYLKGRGWEIKYNLMRAYILGIKAMREIDPAIRVLTTEPLVNIVPPLSPTTQDVDQAERMNNEQFQAVDILRGDLCPELGGSPDLVDILGFNFYYNNQWVMGFEAFLPWLNEVPDPRWKHPAILLKQVYEKYNCPMVLTETSHPKEDRPKWIEFISAECYNAINMGVPLWGICLYPIVDRPDWDDLSTWHQSGLWDADLSSGQRVNRQLCKPYADALLKVQSGNPVLNE